MKSILTFLLFSFSLLVYSQTSPRYIQTTTNTSYINYNLQHNGVISLGALPMSPSQDSAKLQVFNNGPAAISLYNNFGRLQFGVANDDGNYFSGAKKGDAIFRVLGESHGLNFVMPNDNNDGSSKIRFADELNKKSLIIFNNGKVTIGTDNFDTDNYNLYVINGIKTEKIKVEIASVNGWADYVFDKNYNLLPLLNLEEFIKQYKHLPEVPSSQEIVDNGGVELKEFNVLLLKKIEELTLYLIEQNKKIEELENKLKELNPSQN